MPCKVRFLDIPDGKPLPLEWLRDLKSDYFFAHIEELEAVGPVFCGCQWWSGKFWVLRGAIGYGQIAHLVMAKSRSGDLLAIHGFTVKAGDEVDDQMAIAEQRLRDLT